MPLTMLGKSKDSHHFAAILRLADGLSGLAGAGLELSYQTPAAANQICNQRFATWLNEIPNNRQDFALIKN